MISKSTYSSNCILTHEDSKNIKMWEESGLLQGAEENDGKLGYGRGQWLSHRFYSTDGSIKISYQTIK